MKRRQYIIAASAVVPLAGCASDSSNSNPSEDTSGPQEAELIESALEELESALDAFESELDSVNDVSGRISFDDDIVQAHLDQAESDLDEAEKGDVEQGDLIDATRGMISLLRSIVRSFEYTTDAIDEFQTGATYLQNERYNDAESSFVEATDLINQSQDEFAVAEENLSEIDFDEFSESGEIDRLEMETALEDLDTLNTDLEYMGRTYRDLARGFSDFIPAADSFDSEQYDDAEEGFRNARNHFSSAASTIKEGEESATDDLIDDFIGLTCYAEALRDAADYYTSASEAASNGNWDTAESYAEDANAALERCDYEGV